MAKLYNLVRVFTATTGSGTMTLGVPVQGFLSFAAGGVPDGAVVSYGIRDGANSEVGTGTYTSAGATLTRSVTSSTNLGAFINLSGTAEVYITARAQDIVEKTGDTMTGNLTAPALLSTGVYGLVQIDNTAANGQSYLRGSRNGSIRWDLLLGNGTAETGGGAGSNFAISNYNDAGEFISSPLYITRSTGKVTMGSGLDVTGAVTISGNVTASYFYLDTVNTFYGVASGVVYLGFDLNDFLFYTRSTNTFGLNISGATPLTITSTAVTANTNLVSNYGVSAGGFVGEFGMFESAGYRYFSFGMTAQHYFWLDAAGGNLAYRQWGVDRISIPSSSGYLIVHTNASKPGGGVFLDSSDARIKTVEGDYTRGLDDVAALHPVLYTFKGNDTDAAPTLAHEPPTFDEQGREIPKTPSKEVPTVPYPNSPHHDAATKQTKYAGLIAQEVQAVMPEMVKAQAGYIDGAPVTDLLTLDTTPLIFALVNAVKTLKARVEALEAA